jgi:hypothetical protein
MHSASTNSHLGLENAPSKHLVAQKAEHWFLSDALNKSSEPDIRCNIIQVI